VVVDPGTAFYGGDPAARNRFRSTLHHNTLALDGGEQRPLGEELFQLRGGDRAWPAARSGADGWSFTRPLGGGALHRRTLRVTPEGVTVRDDLEGTGRHLVQWRFHLHPDMRATRTEGGFRLEVGDAGALRLDVAGTKLSWQVLPSECSPGYGAIERTQVCAANGELALPTSVAWTFRPAG
jgi:hypothetical protein